VPSQLKNNYKETVIYQTSIVGRLIMFFFYYWLMLTVLLFLIVIGATTGIFGWEIIESAITHQADLESKKTGNWIYVFAGTALTVLLSYLFFQNIKQILKPVQLFEGVVTDKEEIEYDEGCGYFIYLKPGNKQKIEVNGRSFEKIKIGNRLRIKFSNKLKQPVKITRIT